MNGRDFFAAKYASALEAEARWAAFEAPMKADSVTSLVPRRPASVMELGAGTGALIGELQRRGFADRYVAVDYSPEACTYMRQRLARVAVHQVDVTERIPDEAEVIVASHVVEHLEEPDRLLAAIARARFEWFVVECPLEDLAASRLKNRFRDRTRNLAGHVQFFTPTTLRELVGRHFEIVGHRHYAPWRSPEVVRFVARKDGLAPHVAAAKHLTMHLAPRLLAPLWKRLWYGHYALLCRRR